MLGINRKGVVRAAGDGLDLDTALEGKAAWAQGGATHVALDDAPAELVLFGRAPCENFVVGRGDYNDVVGAGSDVRDFGGLGKKDGVSLDEDVLVEAKNAIRGLLRGLLVGMMGPEMWTNRS